MELKYRSTANGLLSSRDTHADDDDGGVVGDGGASDPKVMFKQIHKKALSMGIQQHELCQLQFTRRYRHKKPNIRLQRVVVNLLLASLTLLTLALISWHLDWPVSQRALAQVVLKLQGMDASLLPSQTCLVTNKEDIKYFFRPLEDCQFCRDVHGVDRLDHVTPSEFEVKYAYTGRPLIISDGAANWSAVGTFNLDFFRDMYKSGSPVLQSQCQFFSYQFDFDSLQQVFRHYSTQEHMKNESNPVYFGWENCDVVAAEILRRYYTRPYFMPEHSESAQSEWLFMGSPGFGAHMHIDNVRYPSWQAQISGHKTWTLQPPSECYLECPSKLTATVHPGEIIVIDTNKWFHSTLIVGEEVSITIGAEYD